MASGHLLGSSLVNSIIMRGEIINDELMGKTMRVHSSGKVVMYAVPYFVSPPELCNRIRQKIPVVRAF